jgi:hypothetical protein
VSEGRHRLLAARARRRRANELAFRRRLGRGLLRCYWSGAIFCEDSSTPEGRVRAFRRRLKRWNRQHPNGQPKPRMVRLPSGNSFYFDDAKPRRWPSDVLIQGITESR